jgi:16S rRNA (guanine966-N2)-methyltransferase
MSIRIVAGTLKRRTLKTPLGLATRPTAGRVREALFSILGDIEGARVLDLYAGSGALGIEAISRGAERALFVECDRDAASCIRDNIASLALGGQATLLARPAERVALGEWRAAGPFDLVLCDPPWSDLEAAVTVLQQLAPALVASSRVVLEHPRRAKPELSGFVRADRREWGDSAMSLFSLESAPSPI